MDKVKSKILPITLMLPMFLIALKVKEIITLDWWVVLIPLAVEVIALGILIALGKTNEEK
jgi:hypothetical protein